MRAAVIRILFSIVYSLIKHYDVNCEFTHCIDIDECTNGTHNCNQHCRNIPGSYQCSCDRYFDLDEDARTCLGN